MFVLSIKLVDRKIEMSELSKVGQCGSIICASGILCGVEMPKMLPCFENIDVGRESTPVFAKVNSFIAACVVDAAKLVLRVLGVGSNSEITSLAIETVVVNVVDLQALSLCHDELMERDTVRLSGSPLCKSVVGSGVYVERDAVAFARRSVPSALGDAFVVLWRYLCEKPPTEGDFKIGFQKWGCHARKFLSKRFRVGLCRVFQALDAPILTS
jgi:hypothetical protein